MSTKHLHHADHNSKLARKLLEEGEFYDWAVTTAFYACSHYIKYYLFPLEDHGIDKMPGSIESLDEYCSLKGGITDKHGALYDLFQDKCTNRGIDVDFRKLMNDCWMARYNDYQISESLAKDAIQTMERISKICSTKREGKKRKRLKVKPKSS